MKAVFFDVDYTLIHPGPTFGGDGYRAFAARHGLRVDPARFAAAVSEAAAELDFARNTVYRPDPFIRYAARVLRGMGADGRSCSSTAARARSTTSGAIPTTSRSTTMSWRRSAPCTAAATASASSPTPTAA